MNELKTPELQQHQGEAIETLVHALQLRTFSVRDMLTCANEKLCEVTSTQETECALNVVAGTQHLVAEILEILEGTACDSTRQPLEQSDQSDPGGDAEEFTLETRAGQPFFVVDPEHPRFGDTIYLGTLIQLRLQTSRGLVSGMIQDLADAEAKYYGRAQHTGVAIESALEETGVLLDHLEEVRSAPGAPDSLTPTWTPTANDNHLFVLNARHPDASNERALLWRLQALTSEAGALMRYVNDDLCDGPEEIALVAPRCIDTMGTVQMLLEHCEPLTDYLERLLPG